MINQDISFLIFMGFATVVLFMIIRNRVRDFRK